MKAEKQKLKRKLLKIELKGLITYKEYLTAQYIDVADKKTKKKYSRYIEDQAVETQKKIEKIAAKLKK
ncbi:MAG: hypothetical protein AB8B80_15780, partial [Marinicellaceae bacterium]